jgi:hypothetical protein
MTLQKKLLFFESLPFREMAATWQSWLRHFYSYTRRKFCSTVALAVSSLKWLVLWPFGRCHVFWPKAMWPTDIWPTGIWPILCLFKNLVIRRTVSWSRVILSILYVDQMSVGRIMFDQKTCGCCANSQSNKWIVLFICLLLICINFAGHQQSC